MFFCLILPSILLSILLFRKLKRRMRCAHIYPGVSLSSFLYFSFPALFLITLHLVLLSVQLILAIILQPHITYDSNRFLFLCVIVHISLPYNAKFQMYTFISHFLTIFIVLSFYLNSLGIALRLFHYIMVLLGH